MINKITLANIRPLSAAPSDDLLPGVRQNKRRFQAWLSIYGVQTFIGSYKTNLEAGIAWLEAKVDRDSQYLEDFKTNLANDKAKLTKLKASQERELNRGIAA